MSDPESPSRRVLVVDDSPAICELLRLCLADIAEVLIAHTGGEAVGLALETQPDVMIVDIVLPGMNGFEVVQALRDTSSRPPRTIVFITGLTEPANDYRAAELGAAAVFHKPLAGYSIRQLVLAALETAIV